MDQIVRSVDADVQDLLDISYSQGFIFSLPSGHFFGSSAALNINLFGFEHSSLFLTLIRGVGNTFIILLTAIVCYHKLRTLLAKDGAD